MRDACSSNTAAACQQSSRKRARVQSSKLGSATVAAYATLSGPVVSHKAAAAGFGETASRLQPGWRHRSQERHTEAVGAANKKLFTEPRTESEAAAAAVTAAVAAVPPPPQAVAIAAQQDGEVALLGDTTAERAPLELAIARQHRFPVQRAAVSGADAGTAAAAAATADGHSNAASIQQAVAAATAALADSDMQSGAADTSLDREVQQQLLQPENVVHLQAAPAKSDAKEAAAAIAETAQAGNETATRSWDAAVKLQSLKAKYSGPQSDAARGLVGQWAEGLRETERSNIASVHDLFTEANNTAAQHGLGFVLLEPEVPSVNEDCMRRRLQPVLVQVAAVTCAAGCSHCLERLPSYVDSANVNENLPRGSVFTVQVTARRAGDLQSREVLQQACKTMEPQVVKETKLQLTAALLWCLNTAHEDGNVALGPLLSQVEQKPVPQHVHRLPRAKHTSFACILGS